MFWGGVPALLLLIQLCQAWAMDLYSRHFSEVHWGTPPCLGHRLKGIPALGAQSHSDLQHWDPPPPRAVDFAALEISP